MLALVYVLLLLFLSASSEDVNNTATPMLLRDAIHRSRFS